MCSGCSGRCIRQTPASVALLRGRRRTRQRSKDGGPKTSGHFGFPSHLLHKRFYGGERKSINVGAGLSAAIIGILRSLNIINSDARHPEHCYNIKALVIVERYLRRGFAHFEVITHFLDL